MENNMSIWREVKCDFYDDIDNKWNVDAWLTDDGDEFGTVIAEIDDTGEVRYIDDRAETDPYAQEVIREMINKRKEEVDETINQLLKQLGKNKEDLVRELVEIKKWFKTTKYSGLEELVSLGYMFYKYQNFKNRVTDVKNHATEMEIEISDEEAEEVTTRFLNKYDCNATENDQIEYLIEKVVKEREM